ncbi:MAG: PQQ-binding-like beta-propeller repeat protein [Candidatus Eremiobacterota bacterium]
MTCDCIHRLLVSSKKCIDRNHYVSNLFTLHSSLFTLHITMKPPSIGQRLHNTYQITRILGRGGQCLVYLAYDVHRGKDVVIKELLRSEGSIADEIKELELFRGEYRILSQLDHPSLPKGYDFFVEGSKYFISVEYIEGQNLEDIIKKSKEPLYEEIVLNWARQLAEILTYFYNLKPFPLVLRDIKPSNIVITPQGLIKPVDFTIAKFLKREEKEDSIKMGSPGYAPREQYLGRSDTRSDIYSFGATMYYFLTKYDPAENPFNFPPLKTLNPEVSQEFSALIHRTLRDNPDERFQSPLELLEELDKISAKYINKYSGDETEYGEGEKYFAVNAWRLALKHFRKAIDSNPNNAKYHFRAGECLYNLRDVFSAFEQVNSVPFLFPDVNPLQVEEWKDFYDRLKHAVYSSWPEKYRDCKHTNNQCSPENISPDPVPAKFISLPEKSVLMPVIYEGTACIVLYRQGLASFDLLSGERKWFFRHMSNLSVPSVTGDRVIFGSDDTFIYCLSRQEGKELWKFKTPGPVTVSPEIKEGYVYFISYYEHIYAIDIEDGKELWSLQTKKPVHNMAINNDLIVLLSSSGYMYGIDYMTGKIKSSVSIFPSSYISIIKNMILLTGENGISVVKDSALFDSFNVKILFPPVTDREFFYAATEAGIACFDCTGRISLKYTSSDMPEIKCSPVMAGEFLFLISGRTLYVTDMSLNICEKIDLNFPPSSPPVIADGNIYIVSEKKLHILTSPERASMDYLKTAVTYFEKHDYKSAIKDLEKSLKFSQTNIEALSLLAKSCYLSGGMFYYNRAIEYAKQALSLESRDEFHELMGDSYFSLRKYEEALQEYNLLLSSDEKNPVYLFKISVIYMAKKNFSDAITKLEELAGIETKSVNFYYLASAYFRNGKLDKSLSLYKEARQRITVDEEGNCFELDSDGNRSEILPLNLRNFLEGKRYITLFNIKSLEDSIKIIEDFLLCLTYFKETKYDETLDMLNNLLKLDSEFAYGYHLAGKIYVEKRDYLDARGYFRDAIKYKDNEAIFYLDYAKTQYLIGEVASSREVEEKFRKATELYCTGQSIEINDTIEEEFNVFGDNYFNENSFDLPVFLYGLLKELNKNKAIYPFKLGKALMGQRRYLESLKHFQEAILLDNRNPFFYGEAGIAYHNLGEDDSALENFAKTMSHKLTGLEVYSKLKEELEVKIRVARGLIGKAKNHFTVISSRATWGRYELLQNKKSEVRAGFEQAFKILPLRRDFRELYAEIFEGEKLYDKALEQIKICEKLRPDLLIYKGKAGDLYMKKKEWVKAIDCYVKLPFEREYFPFLLNLARAYCMKWSIDSAYSLLDNLMKNFPSFSREIEEKRHEIDNYVRFYSWNDSFGYPSTSRFQASRLWDQSLHASSVSLFLHFKKNFDPAYSEDEVRLFRPNFFIADPVVFNKEVYIATEKGELHVMDMEKEYIKFTLTLPERIRFITGPTAITHPPAVTQDKIFITAGRFIYSINKSAMEMSRFMQLRLPYRPTVYHTRKDLASLSSGPVWNKGFVYCTLKNGSVCSLNEDLELFRWTFNCKEKLLSPPCLSKDKLLFTALSGNVYALSEDSGNLLWVLKTYDKIVLPPVIYDETAFVVTHRGKIMAIELDNGQIIWEFSGNAGKVSVPPCAGEHIVYCGTDKHMIYGLDISDGNVMKEINVKYPVKSIALTEKDLFFTANRGYSGGILCAVDLEDFHMREIELLHRPGTSPALANGMVCITDKAGYLYVFASYRYKSSKFIES